MKLDYITRFYLIVGGWIASIIYFIANFGIAGIGLCMVTGLTMAIMLYLNFGYEFIMKPNAIETEEASQ